MIYNFEKLTFNVLTVAAFKHTDGFFKVRGRPYSALSLRTRGTGFFCADGKNFKSSPGNILFVPANKDYEVSYTDSESVVVHMVDCNYTSFENIPTSNSAPFELLFNEILNHPGKFNKQKSLIYKLFTLLENFDCTSDADFQKCIDYIGQNFCKSELSVSDICRIAHMSESALRRKFLSCCGSSCKQYINNLRLNKAIDMLIGSEYSIKQISHSCGFDDEKYFSRLIKKRYGAAPSDFRI